MSAPDQPDDGDPNVGDPNDGDPNVGDPNVGDPNVGEPDYETARDELTEVVRRLEQGGLALEESLALWERGEALVAVCERHLAGARQRIESAIAERDEPPTGQ